MVRADLVASVPRRLKRKTFMTPIPKGRGKLVGRKSRWANPFKIGEDGTRAQVLVKYRAWLDKKLRDQPEKYDLSELRGKDLYCYCSLDEKCHADILLELANKT